MLLKNKIQFQHLTSIVKPRDIPMKKEGKENNNAPVQEMNPMIFEGNFPILKLNRIDKRLPVLGIRDFFLIQQYLN